MGLAADSAAFNDAARLHSRCGCFGARIDLLGCPLARDPLGQSRWIVELKTSTKVQPTFALQTAGQVLALAQERGVALLAASSQALGTRIHRAVLQLRADGSFDERRDWHVHDDPDDFAQVTDAARVAHWRMRNDAKAKKLAPHDHALYRDDGTQVPGIGTVLGLAGLVDLRDVPPHILEAAARKGSLVHTAIEYLVADDLDEDALDPALKGYVESFKRFRDATGFQVEACEKSVIFDCSR